MFNCPYRGFSQDYRVSSSITIHTSTKKLYLYRAGKLFKIFPVAIGKPATPTPRGEFKIINKAINPGGPFGVRWLGLNKKGYGIHGTSNPASIGKAISNGCIRMYNKDVTEVANIVSIGTPIKIV